MLGFRQEAVDEADCVCSFAHCGRDALHAAGAHVADYEHSRKTALQSLWRTGERPFVIASNSIFQWQIGASQDEALFIKSDTVAKPRCVG